MMCAKLWIIFHYFQIKRFQPGGLAVQHQILDPSNKTYFAIEKLPHELILRIFSFLSFKDLNILNQVSPWMYHMAMDPVLWRNFVLEVQPEFLEIMLEIPRLSKLRQVHLSENNKTSLCDFGRKKDFSHILRQKHRNKERVFQDAFETLISKENVEDLRITTCIGRSLSGVPSEILSKALNQMSNIDIESTQISPNQIKDFFVKMMRKTKIRKMNCKRKDLSIVPPDQIANSVNKLESANICFTNLIDSQTREIFRQISSDTKLEKLDISYNNLGGVQPPAFSEAMNKVVEANINVTYLTGEQTAALFEKMLEQSSLKILKIRSNNLSAVPPHILSKALNKLEVIDIGTTVMTEEQTKGLFDTMVKGTNLKKMDIGGNVGNPNFMPSVPPDILAKALNKLCEARLYYTALTTDQSLAMLKRMMVESKLSMLDIRKVNLTEIPPKLFADAIGHLNEIIVEEVTEAQAWELFNKIAENESELEIINIKSSNLSGIHPQIFSKAANQLKGILVENANLQAEQVTTFFSDMSVETSLKKVDLSQNNISEVHPEELTTALEKVEVAVLINSSITEDQRKGLRYLKYYHNIKIILE